MRTHAMTHTLRWAGTAALLAFQAAPPAWAGSVLGCAAKIEPDTEAYEETLAVDVTNRSASVWTLFPIGKNVQAMVDLSRKGPQEGRTFQLEPGKAAKLAFRPEDRKAFCRAYFMFDGPGDAGQGILIVTYDPGAPQDEVHVRLVDRSLRNPIQVAGIHCDNEEKEIVFP